MCTGLKLGGLTILIIHEKPEIAALSNAECRVAGVHSSHEKHS